MSPTSGPRVPFPLLLLSVAFLPGCGAFIGLYGSPTENIHFLLATAWAPWVCAYLGYKVSGITPFERRLVRLGWMIFIVGTLLSMIFTESHFVSHPVISRSFFDSFVSIVVYVIGSIIFSTIAGSILLALLSPLLLLSTNNSKDELDKKYFYYMAASNYLIVLVPLLGMIILYWSVLW